MDCNSTRQAIQTRIHGPSIFRGQRKPGHQGLSLGDRPEVARNTVGVPVLLSWISQWRLKAFQGRIGDPDQQIAVPGKTEPGPDE